MYIFETGDACLKTPSCCPSGTQCYRKDNAYANCRTSCVKGIHTDDPIQYQTPWECLVLTDAPVGCCAANNQDVYDPNVCLGAAHPVDCCSGLTKQLVNGKYLCLPITAAPSTSLPLTTQKPLPGCTDDNASCAYWASTGQCTANPAFMLKACRNSCKTLGFTLSAQDDCKVLPPCTDDSTSCSYWAATGECNVNPLYMLGSCKKSCKSLGYALPNDCFLPPATTTTTSTL
jgi:hypothetical protein